MFAMRFLRIAFNGRLGSEHGPMVMALLAAVVVEEDRLRYRRAAEFSDAELCAQIGCSSRTLFTARRAAVDAGLLFYEAARKGIPGCYAVVDNTQQNLLTIAGIVSNNCGESDSNERHLSAKSASVVSNNCGESAHLSAKSAEDSEPCAISRIKPAIASLSESPNSNTPPPPSEGGEELSEAQQRREDLTAALVEVTGDDPATDPLGFRRCLEKLLAGTPPYTPAEVRHFGQHYRRLCPTARQARRHRPGLGELGRRIGRARQAMAEEKVKRDQQDARSAAYKLLPKSDWLEGDGPAPPSAPPAPDTPAVAHWKTLDSGEQLALVRLALETVVPGWDHYDRKDFRKPVSEWGPMQVGFLAMKVEKLIGQGLQECVSSEPSPDTHEEDDDNGES